MNFPMHVTPDPTQAINDFLWSMAKARSFGMLPSTEHTLAEHLFRKDAKVILYSSLNGVMALVGDDDLFEVDDDLLLLRLAAKRKRERTRRGKAVEAIAEFAKHFASVGRSPEGEDREDGLRAEHEHAVGATSAETPNPYLSPQGSKL